MSGEAGWDRQLQLLTRLKRDETLKARLDSRVSSRLAQGISLRPRPPPTPPKKVKKRNTLYVRKNSPFKPKTHKF